MSNNLSQTEKNTLIAYREGWAKIFIDKDGGLHGLSPDSCFFSRVPNYFEDLNAIHRLVKQLPNLDQTYSSSAHDYPSVNYGIELGKIAGIKLREVTENMGGAVLGTFIHATPFETFKLVSADAAQCAEAYGRALKLW